MGMKSHSGKAGPERVVPSVSLGVVGFPGRQGRGCETCYGEMDGIQTEVQYQGGWVGGRPDSGTGWGAEQLKSLISSHCPKGCPILGTARYKGTFTG